MSLTKDEISDLRSLIDQLVACARHELRAQQALENIEIKLANFLRGQENK